MLTSPSWFVHSSFSMCFPLLCRALPPYSFKPKLKMTWTSRKSGNTSSQSMSIRAICQPTSYQPSSTRVLTSSRRRNKTLLLLLLKCLMAAWSRKVTSIEVQRKKLEVETKTRWRGGTLSLPPWVFCPYYDIVEVPEERPIIASQPLRAGPSNTTIASFNKDKITYSQVNCKGWCTCDENHRKINLPHCPNCLGTYLTGSPKRIRWELSCQIRYIYIPQSDNEIIK